MGIRGVGSISAVLRGMSLFPAFFFWRATDDTVVALAGSSTTALRSLSDSGCTLGWAWLGWADEGGRIRY